MCLAGVENGVTIRHAKRPVRLDEDIAGSYKIEFFIYRYPPFMAFVYFIRAHTPVYIHKIGYSQNTTRRVRQLQTASYTPLKVVEQFGPIHNARTVEQLLHKKYRTVRIHGEWYALSPIDILHERQSYLQYRDEYADRLSVETAQHDLYRPTFADTMEQIRCALRR